MKKYVDYVFEDQDSGEMFCVEIAKEDDMTDEECLAQAWERARDNFEEPELIEEIPEWYAEILGYDTY